MVLEAVIENILAYFTAYANTVSFVVAYIGGVEAIFLLGFLTAQDISLFWPVFIFTLLGYYFFELTWFVVARTKLVNKLRQNKKFSSKYDKIAEILRKLSGGNDFIALLAAKILYGFGTVILIYLSRERLTYKRFFVYNTLAISLSTFSILGLGWLTGRGFIKVADVFDDVRLGLLIFVLVAILFYLAREGVKKLLIRVRKLPVKA